MGAQGHGRSGHRTHRRALRPRDVAWAWGRRLVLVDIENIVGGECSTEARTRWAQRRLADEIGDVSADFIVVAVDASGLANVAWEWRSARCLIGYGKDGA